MKHAPFVVALVASLAAASSAPSQPPPGPGVTYQPIPAGFDFPADEAQQLRLRDAQDVAGMRRHAWMVFAGATQRAPGGEAVWETWYPSPVTFSATTVGPVPEAAGFPGRPLRPFVPIRQHQTPGVPQLQAPGASLMSFVMFNEPGHRHIVTNRLNRSANLTQINNSFPAGTPVERREIPPFPRDAVSLKLVWRVVKANELTPVFVWDGRGTRPDAQGNPEASWPRIVLVDPTRTDIPADERRDGQLMGRQFPNSRVVSLNRFYNFRISQAEIAAVNVMNPQARVGDYAVLVAMHVTTKEIPDWVWATFWWHDQPNDGPFATDRPSEVGGVWRNYLMDVAYSVTTPIEYDGTPNASLNPYLEARFPGGMGSNCMTCHQRAVWNGNRQVPHVPVTRGPLQPNDPLFVNTTKLDFLWSISRESQPTLPF